MARFVCFAICLSFATSLSAQVQTDRDKPKVLPLPKDEASFHFIVYGDRTGGPASGIKILKQAVKDTNLLDPDMVMTVGDLIQGYNTTPKWIEQMKEFKGVMNGLKCPWFPVAGNHDVYWRGPNKPKGEHEGNYEKHFGPLWYWFKHKNCGFLVLYTDEDSATGKKGYGKDPSLNKMSEKQLAFIKKSLAQMKSLDQVFVFCHHPRWWKDRYVGSDWPKVHKMFVQAGNVKAVFAGHIHQIRYEGKKDGIEYLTLATVGGSIPGHNPNLGYLHHFNLITVRKGRYSIATIPVGTVIDPRQYTPERIAEIRKLAVVKPIFKNAAELDMKGNGAGTISFTLENPVQKPLEISLFPQPSAGWVFLPDHLHMKLEPGKKVELKLRYVHALHPASKSETPRLRFKLDYLDETSRVSIPDRVYDIPVTLAKLPAEFFAKTPNNAIEFKGNQALRISSTLARLPQGAFTVECWVNPNQLTGSQGVIAKTQSSEYGIFLNNGKPSFDVHFGGSRGRYKSVDSPRKLEAGRWSHLAGVFDGKSLRLFVNGKEVGKETATGRRTTNDLPLYIGADPTSTGGANRYFPGKVDEVRISTTARYAGEFEPARRFEPDRRTFLLLHCDRYAGRFSPSHGSNRHAILVGKPKLVEAK